MTDRLVLSVSEAADALGVSDDLVYELTERGELPCLRFGRRKLIPRRAIELLVELAVVDFDPAALIASLSGTTAPGVGEALGAVDLSALPRP
jgi:excisionase family DNA binding protein